MSHARLRNNTVIERIDVPDGLSLADLYEPSFVAQCVPCDATVSQGDVYDDSTGTFAPPVAPTPTLEEAVKTKLAEVMRGYSAAFAPIEAVYPAAEREGWPIQEAEARAVMTDTEAETPVLSALVQLRARGETVAQLAAKVLQNSGQWRMVYAYLTGQQQRMYGEVSALAEQPGITAEDVLAYPVAYALPEGL